MTMIAGGGFAMMAMRLADIRCKHLLSSCSMSGPLERVDVAGCEIEYPASAEFYRILDNAALGFTAFRALHSTGMRIACPTVRP